METTAIFRDRGGFWREGRRYDRACLAAHFARNVSYCRGASIEEPSKLLGTPSCFSMYIQQSMVDYRVARSCLLEVSCGLTNSIARVNSAGAPENRKCSSIVTPVPSVWACPVGVLYRVAQYTVAPKRLFGTEVESSPRSEPQESCEAPLQCGMTPSMLYTACGCMALLTDRTARYYWVLYWVQ